MRRANHSICPGILDLLLMYKNCFLLSLSHHHLVAVLLAVLRVPVVGGCIKFFGYRSQTFRPR